MQFEPVIGLEIHVQLATESKIFCRCSTEFGKAPNANTCPVCLGLPGALPVFNQKVLEFAIKLGLATNCQIRNDSQFSRKNYFYPDLPKSYQISQFDRPICEHGWLDIDLDDTRKRIGITRIHMEEDAGKLMHEEQGGQYSYVDLNRAGVPLLEIVSEPDIRTPEEAKAYMEKIHALVTCLGISNGDMEKGNLRCDANVSLRPTGQEKFGTRTETKNINSFRFVQQAIIYEMERQREELLDGNTIIQETRLWDAEKKVTYSMRGKEEAHDYRYFPEPDLPVPLVKQEWLEAIRASLPELPDAKRDRYMADYSLSAYDASLLVTNREMADFFEATIALQADPKLACNWIAVELARVMNERKQGINEIGITPEQLAEMIGLLQEKAISSKIAKTVFEELLQNGGSPRQIVKDQGLTQISDTGELEQLVQQVVDNNSAQVEQYRSGKTKVFGFFVGQVMKATKGKANPEIVNRMLKERLDA